jgi:uncharacterized coiled-coil protein SlyX
MKRSDAKMAKISSAEKIAKLEMQLADKKAKCEKLQQEIKTLEQKINDERYKTVKGKTDEIADILVKAGISDPMQMDFLIQKMQESISTMKSEEKVETEDSGNGEQTPPSL